MLQGDPLCCEFPQANRRSKVDYALSPELPELRITELPEFQSYRNRAVGLRVLVVSAGAFLRQTPPPEGLSP
jgi:hypothetical protein